MFCIFITFNIQKHFLNIFTLTKNNHFHDVYKLEANSHQIVTRQKVKQKPSTVEYKRMEDKITVGSRKKCTRVFIKQDNKKG